MMICFAFFTRWRAMLLLLYFIPHDAAWRCFRLPARYATPMPRQRSAAAADARRACCHLRYATPADYADLRFHCRHFLYAAILFHFFAAFRYRFIILRHYAADFSPFFTPLMPLIFSMMLISLPCRFSRHLILRYRFSGCGCFLR